MSFKDHFSGQASAYARFRPHYPDELFRRLAALVPGRERSWDCATGSGQAALGLAAHFSRVVATDASAGQIRHARRHPRIEYLVAQAEKTPLAAGSVDLATVAQALHWLDSDPFYAEVRRVVRPGGAVAVWVYGLLSVTPAVDGHIRSFFTETLGPFWPPERRHVDEGYAGLPFPFRELSFPELCLEAHWNLDEMLGYLGSWSAVRRYRLQKGADPLALVKPGLLKAWGDPRRRRRTVWPLRIRAGRVGK